MEVKEYPKISRDPFIQARYEIMRDEGTSHNMAEILAVRKSPNFTTDDHFNKGHCNGNQFDGQEKAAAYYKRKAVAAGVSTTGKVYKSSLARFPGDPQAWVSSRSDVKKILEERNWQSEGTVKNEFHEDKLSEAVENRPKANGVAEDILDDKVVHECLKNPELAPTVKERIELKENLRSKMSAPD